MRTQLFENCDVFTGTEYVSNAAVLVADSRIVSAGKRDKVVVGAPSEAEVVDLGGGLLSAGYVDVQVNGGGGVLFNDDPSVSGLATIIDAHRKLGTTSIVPTFITGSPLGMTKAHSAAVAYTNSSSVAGVHYEGPALASNRLGVHDPEYRSDTFPISLSSLSRELPIIVTLAPETSGVEIISELRAQGVHVAAGHSNATYDEFVAGIEAGVTLVTHLFNAMRPFAGRDPGIVGGALVDDRVAVSIILDGYHIDWASGLLAWKTKPRGKCFFVTDAMPPVGASIDHYFLGDLEILYRDGRCVTRDGTLGGSALSMAEAVKNAVTKLGIPRSEALNMASLYPARFLGVETRVGQIRTGCFANFVILDNECNVLRTYFEGDLVANY